MVLSIVVFAFATWCVFGKHFDDGLIAKHLLSLSAILAALVILDPTNYKASVCSSSLLVLGVLYAYLRPTRRRPFLRDRREKQRPF